MTIYRKYTDKNGCSSVLAHQVWDKSRFLEARAADAKKEGGSAVEVDSATYRELNWPKR